MDREEQQLRDELERLAPEPDDSGALETVVSKGRSYRRRRRYVRSASAVVAIALVVLVVFGAVRLVDGLRSDPDAGGWSDMGAPAAGGSTTSLEETISATSGGAPTGTSYVSSSHPDYHVLYLNADYDFYLMLPDTWANYSTLTQEWQGQMLDSDQEMTVTGPEILIRHPLWTESDPRQDIPVLIFTLAQWELVQAEKLGVGAAPIPPSELGRNSTYVFALPARYNFAFPTGFEEVEQIVEGVPIQATPPGI